MQTQLDQAVDATARSKVESALTDLHVSIKTAQGTIEKYQGQTTSLVGLEKLLIALKNPGIYSIPFGFLCVIFGSLLWRERRSEEMWEELYVRQNTGIAAEQASH